MPSPGTVARADADNLNRSGGTNYSCFPPPRATATTTRRERRSSATRPPGDYCLTPEARSCINRGYTASCTRRQGFDRRQAHQRQILRHRRLRVPIPGHHACASVMSRLVPEGTRTPTMVLPSADFKSAAYAIPPLWQVSGMRRRKPWPSCAMRLVRVYATRLTCQPQGAGGGDRVRGGRMESGRNAKGENLLCRELCRYFVAFCRKQQGKLRRRREGAKHGAANGRQYTLIHAKIE